MIAKFKVTVWFEPEMCPNCVLSARPPASDTVWGGGRAFGDKCTRKKWVGGRPLRIHHPACFLPPLLPGQCGMDSLAMGSHSHCPFSHCDRWEPSGS